MSEGELRSPEERVALVEGWFARMAGEIGPGGLPLDSTSNVYENSRVVKAGAGTLFGFSGMSTCASAQWIQAHDARELPANGAVPKVCIAVPALPAGSATNFWISFDRWGRAFHRGIILVNSTTGPTLTIGVADCWFDAQYV